MQSLSFQCDPTKYCFITFRPTYPGYFCSSSPSDNVRTESIIKEVTKQPFLVMTERYFTLF